MRRLLALMAVVSALAALAACGSEPADGPGGPGTPTAAELDGRTFVSEGLTLSFREGSLSAQPGCNTVGGPYDVEGGKLVVTELAMTEMACLDQALMDRDTAFVAFLQAGPTITLDGPTLTLATADTTWVLTDEEVADPDRPLEGSWTLEGLVDGETASSVTAGVDAGIVVAAGWDTVGTDTTLAGPTQMTWWAGCEIAGAEITVDDDSSTITLGRPLAIANDCTPTSTPEDDRRTFEAMGAVLTGTVSYEIDADRLTVTNGDRGLQLRAAP
jgi:heat shock protein HslJ